MIRPFDLTIRNRKLSLLLDVEPGRFYSDFALSHYLDNGMAPEPELLHVLFRALRPGDLAVDAGANVGFFTLVMSKLVGDTGKTIAIEPDDRNLRMLRKNLDINDCANVEIVPAALGDRVGTSRFYESEENGQSSVYAEMSKTGFTVDMTTLTRVLGDRCPALLKMDIEGSEIDALRGLDDFHSYIPFIVSEVNPEALRRADSSPEELIEKLDERGYTPFVLHADGSLPSSVRFDQKINISRPNTNMLFTTSKQIAQLWPEVEA